MDFREHYIELLSNDEIVNLLNFIETEFNSYYCKNYLVPKFLQLFNDLQEKQHDLNNPIENNYIRMWHETINNNMIVVLRHYDLSKKNVDVLIYGMVQEREGWVEKFYLLRCTLKKWKRLRKSLDLGVLKWDKDCRVSWNKTSAVNLETHSFLIRKRAELESLLTLVNKV